MVRSFIRRFGAVAYAAVIVSGAVAVSWKPEPLRAQTGNKCYLVVCNGNVCVWEQITCPPPPPT